MKKFIFISLLIISPFSYTEDIAGTQSVESDLETKPKIELDLLILEVKSLKKSSDDLVARLKELAEMQSQYSESIQNAIEAAEKEQTHYRAIQEILIALKESQTQYETTQDVLEHSEDYALNTDGNIPATHTVLSSETETHPDCSNINYSFDLGLPTDHFVYASVRDANGRMIYSIRGQLTNTGLVITYLKGLNNHLEQQNHARPMSFRLVIETDLGIAISNQISIKHKSVPCNQIVLEPTYDRNLMRQAVSVAWDRLNKAQRAFQFQTGTDEGTRVRSPYKEVKFKQAQASFDNAKDISEIVIK